MKPLDATGAPLSGTMLVEASAGTGKTYTITTLFVRLVAEEGIPVKDIVVVTFTEAATAELRGRIRARLREAIVAYASPSKTKDETLKAVVATSKDRAKALDRLERAVSELDLAAVSTIHAFCLRVLQERAFESGARFGLELLTDASELKREVGEDFFASRMVPMKPDLYRMQEGAFGLEATHKLVDTFMRRPPDLPVLPGKMPPDPELLRPKLATLYAAARKTWMASGAEIRALLDGGHLYATEYGARLEDWCSALDTYFGDGAATFSTAMALWKMTPPALEEGTKKTGRTPRHPFFKQAEALYDLCQQAEDDLVVRLKLDAVAYVRDQMPRRKRARGVQGYEDLLFSLDEALQGPGADRLAEALRGQFQAALIDEFQDTDPVQFRIFRRIFHGARTLLLVGDPKQSIYAFRGADVFSYITAAGDAGKSAYTLGTNHRSDPSLITAVNTVFSRAKKPVFVLDQIGFESVEAFAKTDRIKLPNGQAALEILFLPAGADGKPLARRTLELALPGLVATEIARFLGSGATIEGNRVAAGHVAVLTRSNKEARQVQDALRKLGIPTALESEASVFQSAEAIEVEQVLRAVLEPTRAPLVKSALATSIVGLRAEQIAALEGNETQWQAWSDRLRAVQEDWAQSGFVQAYRRMLTSFEAEGRLLSYVDGERRITNLLHLGELLHLASERERLGPVGTVRWLGARRAETEAGGMLGNEASELRLESDERSVKLLTVHKSKGLEYPVVYCPYLWGIRNWPDGVCTAFHDPEDDHQLKMHVDPDDSVEAIASNERHAEHMRLLYVALTRARHRCSIVWGRVNEGEDSPLNHVLHPARVGTKVSEITEAQVRADLDALVKESGKTVSVRELLPGEPPGYKPEEAAVADIRTRPYDRTVDAWWRIGSFSSLTSGGRAHALPDEARDRDEVEEEVPEPAPVPVELKERVILDGFPRGTKPGLLLHSVLEDHDFTATDPAALDALVNGSLASYGYTDAALGPMLVQGIDAMLRTPLGPAGVMLRGLPRGKRIDELEFFLPVAQERSEVTAKGVAEAFAKHAGPSVPASYVEQLRRLRFLPLRGFLRGFVDLVFEHEGRFYVVDYKSNHLGSAPGDYAPDRLATAMADNDYHLQAHLYVVAVDHWLKRRMRGYDYERNFGGVLYLFARGMSPAHAPGTGVFFDRPGAALVGALSEVLHG